MALTHSASTGVASNNSGSGSSSDTDVYVPGNMDKQDDMDNQQEQAKNKTPANGLPISGPSFSSSPSGSGNGNTRGKRDLDVPNSNNNNNARAPSPLETVSPPARVTEELPITKGGLLMPKHFKARLNQYATGYCRPMISLVIKLLEEVFPHGRSYEYEDETLYDRMKTVLEKAIDHLMAEETAVD
ncbi:MAG: hypothetical protein M1816_001412 [Peltula sp. TS41687]|nr:MAG: hypothetical protein M1816_001412 [Peltula sp. TS41687]